MFLENILCTIAEKYTVRTAEKQIKLISNVICFCQTCLFTLLTEYDVT